MPNINEIVDEHVRAQRQFSRIETLLDVQSWLLTNSPVELNSPLWDWLESEVDRAKAAAGIEPAEVTS